VADEYLVVKNFEKFQHYKKLAIPAWIKLHRSLLTDFDFQALPDTSKAHLMMIWLLVSQRNDRRIPNNALWIAQKIGSTEPVNLPDLIGGGWLIPLDHFRKVGRPRLDKNRSDQIRSDPPIVPPTGDVGVISFDTFWTGYPRKDGKKPAAEAFAKLTLEQQGLAIADVPLRVSANWAGRELSKIPHATTYLNQRRWEDELMPANGRASPGLRLNDGHQNLFQSIVLSKEKENGRVGNQTNPTESIGHLEPPTDRRRGSS